MKIRVAALHRIQSPYLSESDLVARANVEIGSVLIRGYTVHQKKGKKATVTPPRFADTRQNVVEFPAETHCAIQRLIVGEWEKLTGVYYN